MFFYYLLINVIQLAAKSRIEIAVFPWSRSTRLGGPLERIDGENLGESRSEASNRQFRQTF